MIFGYLTLFTALIISLSAAVYSILGLTAIFAAAFWPIVIMGGSLEFGKIMTTLWLHKYWDRAEIQYKVYLCSAVAILMLLTSMGVFGFLSKAHTDQAIPTGDVAAQVAIVDEKIKIERDNIENARALIGQLDGVVNALTSGQDRTARRADGSEFTISSAERALTTRRSQAKDRAVLTKQIETAQSNIVKLQAEKAPYSKELRKVEAEVGPIKYIAAMVYGDNPDANLLEKAVRWVIILIVIVFDPLALTLLLAATKSLEWERGINILSGKRKESKYEPDDGGLTDAQIKQINDTMVANEILRKGATTTDPENSIPLNNSEQPKVSIVDNIWKHTKKIVINDEEAEHAPLTEVPVKQLHEEDHIDGTTTAEKEAQRRWKAANPNETIKKHRALYDAGKITKLPWNNAEFCRTIDTGFGKTFPDYPDKGDIFLRTDRVPTVLYRYTGTDWIQIDKDVSTSYAYNSAYIDYLIEKISSGEYDPELLSLNEQISIEQRLNQNV